MTPSRSDPTVRPPRRFDRTSRSGVTLDVTMALAFFALISFSVVAYTPLVETDRLPPPWLGITLGAAMTVPLAWRRRIPLTVLAIVTAAFSAFRLTEAPEWSVSSFTLFVALYTVGAELPPERSRLPRAAVLAIVAGLVIYAWATVLASDALEIAGRELVFVQVAEAGLNLLFGAAAWVLGDIAWRRRSAETALSEQLDELTANREELARRAVQDERVRIARELHDVVAHHVSVMGIQAGAARRSIERSPHRAGEALASVEQSSRDAVTEMQRLLLFLRSHDDHNGESLTPQPSLGQLQALVDAVRETGLDVVVEVTGSVRPLPDTVELSAYRIVQEALTNTLKHGDDVTGANVQLTYEPDRLRLDIRDDGTAAARSDPTSEQGRGLMGMRERAALHGGELEAGPLSVGGFAVSGWLPTGARAGPNDETERATGAAR